MSDIALSTPSLPAMSEAGLAKVRALEDKALALPQVSTETHHVLHAGLYARTILLPGGTMITGALIKIATLVIVEGDVLVWLGNITKRLKGYNILPASAGRKQAFFSLDDSHITMIFPTDASDVESAEIQFTDEHDLLASRREDARNLTIITGEN